jgi:hypothetical protein
VENKKSGGQRKGFVVTRLGVKVRAWLCRSSFAGRASFTVKLAAQSTFILSEENIKQQDDTEGT